MSPTSPQEDGMVRTIAEARALLAQKDYHAAMNKAVEATRSCPCGQSAMHPRDKSCNILQCTQAVRREEFEKVGCSECKCGFVWPSCTRPSHIDAVDLLADCSVKADRHAAAFSIALGLIRLDPASPAGYCRVVTIMRHLVKAQLDAQGPETRSLMVILQASKLGSVNTFAELIRPFIRCGLRNTPLRRNTQDAKYRAILQKMAHHMRMPEAKVNPLSKLPPEVLSMIFSHVDLTSLLRCMRVSKEWNRLILSDQTLWYELRIKKPRNPSYPLVNFIKAHRSIRVLVLEEVADFSLTASKAQILVRGLPSLRRLQLGTTMRRPDRLKDGLGGLSGKYLTLLTHLRLSGVGLPLYRDLAHLASSTLVSLDIRDNAYDLFSVLPPRLPNLKRLRMRYSANIHIGQLAYQTPNLHHLYIDGARIYFASKSRDFGVWDDLRTLVIGETTSCGLVMPGGIDAGVQPVRMPLFSNKIESISLLCTDPYLPYIFIFAPKFNTGITCFSPTPPRPPAEQTYPHLHTFRCRTPIEPPFLQWTLDPAIANKTLTTLELPCTPGSDDTTTAGLPSALSRDPVAAYSFAMCDSLRTLGLFDFNFAPVEHAATFGHAPVLEFLAGCPAVDTVAVYPGAYDIWVLVMELIETGRVKKVYQDRLLGVDWERMQELARRKGVEVVHCPKMMRPEWDLEGW